METSTIWGIGILIGAVGSWAIVLAIYGLYKMFDWTDDVTRAISRNNIAIGQETSYRRKDMERLERMVSDESSRHLEEKHSS